MGDLPPCLQSNTHSSLGSNQDAAVLHAKPARRSATCSAFDKKDGRSASLIVDRKTVHTPSSDAIRYVRLAPP
jgi:hypothetical protein